MQNNISPVSFKGQIFVSTFEKGTENFVEHNISDAQFKLIKSVIDGFAPAGETTPVSKFKLKFLFDYLKNAVGIEQKLDKLKTDKIVYNSADNITIKDENARFLQGIEIDIQG